MDVHHLHIVFRGRVQGVGFRWFVLDRARGLGVAGRVRNRADGAVEVEAEGGEAPLHALLDEVRQGPPAARVTAVDDTWSHGPPRHREFRIGD